MCALVNISLVGNRNIFHSEASFLYKITQRLTYYHSFSSRSRHLVEW